MSTMTLNWLLIRENKGLIIFSLILMTIIEI